MPNDSVHRGTPVDLVDENGTPTGVHRSGTGIQVCPEEHHTAFTEEYTANGSGNIDAVAIITPTVGSHLSIHVFQMQTDGASGTVSLDFVTSSKKVGKLYVSKRSTVEVSQDHSFGAIDEVLTLSASGIGSGTKVFVKIQYIEEGA